MIRFRFRPLQTRWTRSAAPLAALALLAACPARDGGEPGAGRADSAQPALAEGDACRITRRGVSLPPEVRESSGAALDPVAQGVFWTHGDSGAQPVLYAVAASGQLMGGVRVTGGANRDWEDMAVGPCPGGQCVYMGDIGNNRGGQGEVSLFRAPMPVVADSVTRPAERFRARFPGGGRDTEALFVTPQGEIYLVNKGQDDAVELWRWPTPLRPGPVDLVRVRTLAPEPEQPGDYVTGAAASRDGRWVALRTYSRLALYRTADLLGTGAPSFTMDLLSLGEPQGEAVAMASDGTVLLTSEAAERGLPGRATWLACELPES